MAFKMTVSGLVKRIRSAKGSIPCSDERPGWFAHKVEGRVVRFHVVSIEFAACNGYNEVWAREGEMGEFGFKEYRGTAEKVASEILGVVS